jgi:hypothetical protein
MQIKHGSRSHKMIRLPTVITARLESWVQNEDIELTTYSLSFKQHRVFHSENIKDGRRRTE